jgi:hypothetical protein
MHAARAHGAKAAAFGAEVISIPGRAEALDGF